jgi:hypothetical protein
MQAIESGSSMKRTQEGFIVQTVLYVIEPEPAKQTRKETVDEMTRITQKDIWILLGVAGFVVAVVGSMGYGFIKALEWVGGAWGYEHTARIGPMLRRQDVLV